MLGAGIPRTVRFTPSANLERSARDLLTSLPQATSFEKSSLRILQKSFLFPDLNTTLLSATPKLSSHRQSQCSLFDLARSQAGKACADGYWNLSHAGYSYSGGAAAWAYAAIPTQKMWGIPASDSSVDFCPSASGSSSSDHAIMATLAESPYPLSDHTIRHWARSHYVLKVCRILSL